MSRTMLTNHHQLTANGLLCRRAGRLLFRNLSFIVSRGNILQVHGANGSGKSTLLRMLGGLVRPDEGSISWNGSELSIVRDEFNESLAWLGHDNGVKLSLTARENLLWRAGLFRQSAMSADEALSEVGLDRLGDKHCQELSAGQNRRIALASVLMRKAALWILDEPFTAIDAGTRQILESKMRDFSANGGMIVLTSHDILGHSLVTHNIDLGS